MICLSLGNIAFQKCLEIIKDYELCEIRLDLNNYSLEEVRSIFSSHSNLIATCRPEELSEQQRLEYLKTAIESGAGYVDIELETEEQFRDEIIQTARAENCKVIVSHHDSERTPTTDKQQEIVDKIKHLDQDFIKIVSKANSYFNNRLTLELYKNEENQRSKLLAFNTGEKGTASRTEMMELGAPFTYACLGESKTAEGQIDYKTMAIFMEIENWNEDE